MNASGEILCLLIVSTDRSTLGVFRDGVEEGVDLRVHISGSVDIDLKLFHDYLRDVMIPRIKKFREASGMLNEPAVLLMNKCRVHTSLEVPALLLRHRVKTITFPPHIGCPTSGVAHRAMREAAPHARGVSKATLRRLATVKTR
jgi:hypothetical protein